MLQNNITEALRLFPPLIMLMRQVKRAFTVTTRTGHTYTIPKVLLLKPAQVLICEGPAMVKTVVGVEGLKLQVVEALTPKVIHHHSPHGGKPAPSPGCCAQEWLVPALKLALISVVRTACSCRSTGNAGREGVAGRQPQCSVNPECQHHPPHGAHLHRPQGAALKSGSCRACSSVCRETEHGGRGCMA